MNELDRLKIEGKRLDALVNTANVKDKEKCAQSIRDNLLRRGERISPEDEKILDNFSRGDVSLDSMACHFQGRI